MNENPYRRYLILEDNYNNSRRSSSIEMIKLDMSNYNVVDPFYKRIRNEIETILDLESGRQYNQEDKDRYFHEFNTFSQNRGANDFNVWNLHNQYFDETRFEKFLLGKNENYRAYKHIDVTNDVINFGMGVWPTQSQIKKIKAFAEKNDANTFHYVYLVGKKKVVYATLKEKRTSHNQPDYNYFKIDKNGDLQVITYAEAFNGNNRSKALDLHRLIENINFTEVYPGFIINHAKYKLSYECGFDESDLVPFVLEPKLKLRDTNDSRYHVMQSTKNINNRIICPVDEFGDEWYLI